MQDIGSLLAQHGGENLTRQVRSQKVDEQHRGHQEAEQSE